MIAGVQKSSEKMQKRNAAGRLQFWRSNNKTEIILRLVSCIYTQGQGFS